MHLILLRDKNKKLSLFLFDHFTKEKVQDQLELLITIKFENEFSRICY